MTNYLTRFWPLLAGIWLLAGCGGLPAPEGTPSLPPPPATHTAEAAALDGEKPAAAASTATPAATALAAQGGPAAAAPTRERPAAGGDAIDPTAALAPQRLANMTYSSPLMPGEQVTLANGLYEEQAAPGSASRRSVRLSDIAAFGEINEAYHAAAILISDGGGSGTFYTLHLVGLEEGQPRELGSVLLGDRVIVNELAVEAGQIAVDLTRAGPEDPLCCPGERVRQLYGPGEGGLVLLEETAVVEGPDAPGSTADLVARGLEMDVSGVAKTYAWVVERAAPEADPPRPGRLLLTFDGLSTAEALAGAGPLLAIYPLQPYLNLAADGGQPAAAEQVARLRELLQETDTRPGAPQGWMPLLPPAGERVAEWRDYAALSFGDGPGLRYVRQVGDGPVYTFLGLTADGRYLVTLSWPLAGAEPPALEALDSMLGTLALGAIDN